MSDQESLDFGDPGPPTIQHVTAEIVEEKVCETGEETSPPAHGVASPLLPVHVEAEDMGTPNPKPVKQIRQRASWGRLPVITQAQQDGICEKLKAGNYIEVACRLYGVETETWHGYIKRANDPTSPNLKRYQAFRKAILQAMAEGEAEGLEQIRLAGSLDYRATAWRLSRRFPRKWGDAKGALDEDIGPEAPKPGTPGAPPAVTEEVARAVGALSPEEMLALASKLFAKPEQVEVPDSVMADVQDPGAPPTIEEKARTA